MSPRRRPVVPAFDDLPPWGAPGRPSWDPASAPADPTGNPTGNPFPESEALRSPRTLEEEPAGASDPLELDPGALAALRARSEAIRAGMERARARGVPIGRPPTSPELAARVRKLAAKGRSLRVIVAETGLGINTVRRILAG